MEQNVEIEKDLLLVKIKENILGLNIGGKYGVAYKTGGDKENITYAICVCLNGEKHPKTLVGRKSGDFENLGEIKKGTVTSVDDLIRRLEEKDINFDIFYPEDTYCGILLGRMGICYK